MTEISEIKFKAATANTITDDLLHFEKHEIVRKYKFGVLYVKEGQSEDEIYSNSKKNKKKKKENKLK